MENNENLVLEGAENTEHTAEQTGKTYTEAEINDMVNAKVNEILPSKIARKEAKMRKEYESKYGKLEDVLRAGTGKNSVDEMTDAFTKFYEGKGIKINKKPEMSERDIETLAKAEADEIIRLGDDEVVEEVDRLANIGTDGMTDREKAVFRVLAEHRQKTEQASELAAIGVTKDVYESQEFRDFAGQFNSKTPITKIYEIYAKTQPKAKVQPMGSMKNGQGDEGTVKDFYTRDEALQFTKKDLDKNPALYKAIEASMLKW